MKPLQDSSARQRRLLKPFGLLVVLVSLYTILVIFVGPGDDEPEVVVPTPPRAFGTAFNDEGLAVVYAIVGDRIEPRTVDGIGQVKKFPAVRSPGGVDYAATSVPRYSPDGQRIAFVGHGSDSGEGAGVYLMEANGDDATRVTDLGASESDLAFAPDGGRIAFTDTVDGAAEIFVMNVDGSDRRRLTTDPAQDTAPVFSPDGARIAFTSDRDGNLEIYVMKADGSEVDRLTDNEGADRNPAFSPDGRRIAFDRADPGDGVADIYVMDADGSGVKRLTDDAGAESAPVYSRDGLRLAFLRADAAATRVVVMNADGTGQNPVATFADPGAATPTPGS